MVDLILSNLVGVVLDFAAQLCLHSSSGHWAASTQCGVEAAAIRCIGVEGSLQALQVSGCHRRRTEKQCIADMQTRLARLPVMWPVRERHKLVA